MCFGVFQGESITQSDLQSALKGLAARHPMLRMRLAVDSPGHALSYAEEEPTFDLIEIQNDSEISTRLEKLQSTLNLITGPIWRVDAETSGQSQQDVGSQKNPVFEVSFQGRSVVFAMKPHLQPYDESE